MVAATAPEKVPCSSAATTAEHWDARTASQGMTSRLAFTLAAAAWVRACGARSRLCTGTVAVSQATDTTGNGGGISASPCAGVSCARMDVVYVVGGASDAEKLGWHGEALVGVLEGATIPLGGSRSNTGTGSRT